MRILVDGASCMGHGRCYRIAPDLFSYDDEGYPTIRDELVEVPAHRAAAADEAAATCPEEAIALILE
jgi:ferredoxin